VDTTSITLVWTAPGDDSSFGTAFQYDIRYDTVVVTEDNWFQAEQVVDEPVPQIAGSNQMQLVENLSMNTTYYFALKSADDSGNVSGLSNVAIGITLGYIVWERTYGGPGIEKVHAVTTASDGGIVLCGYTSSYGSGGNDMYVIKTDSHGDVMWEKTFGGSENDYGDDIVRARDGDYVIAGTTHSYGLGPPNVYLVKIGDNGTTDWEVGPVDTLSILGPVEVDCTNDGGYALCGTTSDAKALLVKLDFDANVDWLQRYSGVGCREYHGEGWGRHVINLSSSEIVLIWSSVAWLHAGPSDCGPPSYSLSALRVDYLGNSVKSINMVCGTDSDDAIKTLDDGLLILYSKFSPFPIGCDGNYVEKVNYDGISEWSFRLDFGNEVSTLMARSNGKYILAGHNFGKGMYIASVDQTGNLVRELAIENSDTRFLTSATEAANGDIIIAGYKGSAMNSTQAYLIRISSSF
jgi:hypothetical protein